jgi:hypothetical protein
MYSSFIYRLKLGFGRFLGGTCNGGFGMFCFGKTQVWAIEFLMITELQASRSLGML